MEALADKYDMPTLALVALEELQHHMQHNLDCTSYTDVWECAERAVRWDNTEMLDTCMQAIAGPLEEPTYLHSSSPITLPAATSLLSVQMSGVVRSLVRAVNRALTLARMAHVDARKVPPYDSDYEC